MRSEARARARSRASLPLLAALALPTGAAAQVRRGNEFQVNSHTVYTQSGPSAAADGDGDFVVAWQSVLQDGSGLFTYGIFARRFSSAGIGLASEFQVNTYTPNTQLYPSVAAGAAGDFVVAWQSNTQDGSSIGVFAQRFSNDGSHLGGEFSVNSHTSDVQRDPVVAARDDGDFVVTWASAIQDGSMFGVFARLFSSAGAPLTGEIQVNAYTMGSQNVPAVVADADGDFFVAWNSDHDGSSRGIFGRVFSSAGAALASEFQANTYTLFDQQGPAVAAGTEGDFVVVWRSQGQLGLPNQYDLLARRISHEGAPIATEFQVNVYGSTLVSPSSPSVAALAAGDFVVAWHVFGDGSDYGIFGRHFSSAGDPLTGAFQVNRYTVGHQLAASVAAGQGAGPGGDFVVAWSSFTQDGSFYGVFAQRLREPATLDVDGNGTIEPLTDGLLLLRYLFGFTGATLTTGAVGGGCTRCDAAAIDSYLDGLGPVLDIDGNTTIEPLTDGLLVLRFLFGFTGATLTSGAVGGGCSRCDAAMIEPYLAGLTT
jgi:hypothetical protein